MTSIDALAKGQMALLQNVIEGIRAIRKIKGVPEKELVHAYVLGIANYTIVGSRNSLIDQNSEVIQKLAKVSEITEVTFEDYEGQRYAHLDWRPFGTADVAILYEAKVDVAAERERLNKDIAKYEKGIAAAERQLGNSKESPGASGRWIEEAGSGNAAAAGKGAGGAECAAAGMRK
jgi:valyl-tRNA synthetase